ncbi:glycosyltransferase family 4 protein [Mangrovimonas sp. YM274]|uniref:glycosyltransferase family 4 protein n=1 Tax=Mangrovimonas sp. YM274 TaxID=3070660 RepID=UPI0027DDF26E|nr:glycosyltransferase family 4 protein [Mangrovimonas sp. YM274]WMI68925.1 glycosyltransferase family 4 protein [Mangrovimonas sp. YM274]
MIIRNKTKVNVLIVGPLDKPITGVSICNDLILEGLDKNQFNVKYINTSFDKFDENVGTLSIKKIFYFLKFYFLTYKVWNVDIIYITPGHTFLGIIKYASFILAGWCLRKKVVLHIHSDTLVNTYLKSNKVKKSILTFVISKADRGVVLSKSLVRNLSYFLPKDKIEVLFNFVEDKFILTENEVKIKKYDKIKIVYLSNLMTQKGIFYLLETFNLMLKNKIPFEAKLAGNIDDTIKEQIEKEIKLLNVEYLGVVKGDRKRELLKWGNVFVFPSYLTEGLPISILENMASGNVVFTTKHSSLDDIYKETSLVYIDKKSSDDIYNKVLNCFSDEEAIREMVIKNYNFIKSVGREEVFLRKLMDIFNK